MTQFKENLSVTSTIKPNQSETIHDHEWSDLYSVKPCGGNELVITIKSGDNTKEHLNDYYEGFINKSDAIAIANHFNLIPKSLQLGNVSEYLNGELVETVTNDDLRIGGFMSEDRNGG